MNRETEGTERGKVEWNEGGVEWSYGVVEGDEGSGGMRRRNCGMK